MFCFVAGHPFKKWLAHKFTIACDFVTTHSPPSLSKSSSECPLLTQNLEFYKLTWSECHLCDPLMCCDQCMPMFSSLKKVKEFLAQVLNAIVLGASVECETAVE